MPREIEFNKYKKRGAYHWKDYFGRLLEIDCFLRGRYDMVIGLLEKNGLSKSSNILEIGSGDGALSGLIYKTFGCTITGVEPSADGVSFAKEMFATFGYRATFEAAEGYSFKFPDNHFDFVVLADVIEHLQQPDLMLKEIKRVLKPGGKAIITTPVRTSEYPEDPLHVQEFYPDQLIDLCREYFGNPVEKIYSHPLVWYELYTFGSKSQRSMVRFYCRISDRLFRKNPFLTSNLKGKWKNFKQQALVLQK